MNERQLYRDTLKLIRETNRRLEKLERGINLNRGKYNPKTKQYEKPYKEVVIRDGKKVDITPNKRVSYKMGTWASKKLLERIPEAVVKDKITTNIGKYSKVQLTALNKALRNFIKSETSTVKGIREIESLIKNDIKSRLEGFDTDVLTNEDVEALYKLRSDKDVSAVYDLVTPSELESIVKYSVSKEDDFSQFLKLVSDYSQNDRPFTDLYMQESLRIAYNKMAPWLRNK